MDTHAFLTHVRKQDWYADQIVHLEDVGARPARHRGLSPTLPQELQAQLEDLGLFPLYTHQTQAIEALRQGGNVAVATSTASGKSLCYHVPVLESLIQTRGARALYLFPTKALAQDQLRKVRELGSFMDQPLRCATYDGDTDSRDRGEIRRTGQVVLTNPDMLHIGILPNHGMWKRFFSGLRYVVIDESHVYRGVFGSHVANVIRRLRRVCALYGNQPQFVLCSATVANPGEHAERLTGLPFEVIEEDGSPYGGKDFVMWNPPFIDEAQMTRRSPNSETTLTFSELLKGEVRAIAFSRSRKTAELVYAYSRDRLKEESVPLSQRIRPYRAGYLAEDRRMIEEGLFDGSLLGVSATNALELGIDVGDLDATIINGYPGTIASTWQQAGRSGRNGERSLSILIASDNPLDQYLMRHPSAFFEKPQEHVLIAPTNPYVLKPHLVCAAYEAPLEPGDEAILGEGGSGLLSELEQDGEVREARGRWFPSAGVLFPAEELNIRSATGDFYQVVDQQSGVLIEHVDAGMVFAQLHPGAVYLHKGEPFLVTELDEISRTARVRRHRDPYYTVSRDHTDLTIEDLVSRKGVNGIDVFLGSVEVARTVVGYKRKRQFTDEVIDDNILTLPTQSFTTTALWFNIADSAVGQIDRMELDLPGGLHAAEHASIGMLPFFAMCDRADIGGVSTPLHPDTGRPQIFIYDGHPGGVGITEKGYDLIEELWATTMRAISECPCRSGCPSCIQSPKCGNNNNPLDKRAAQIILRHHLSG